MAYILLYLFNWKKSFFHLVIRLFLSNRDNFFRLTLLLFRLGNTKLREYLKSQWPSVYLKANGTMPAPWTDIRSDAAALKKIGKLRFQFKNQENKFDSGNTDEWDFSLLSLVLLNGSLGFVAASSIESKALKELKEIRNNLIGHAPDAKIPNTVFKTQWATACKALEKFNATQEEFTAVKKGIQVFLNASEKKKKLVGFLIQLGPVSMKVG
jgi:hypothetical protein